MMICRLCLEKLNEVAFLPIFEENNRFTGDKLAHMISKHLFLELSAEDAISTSICQDCYDHLEDFNRFWKRVEQRQKTLQCEFLEIKCEALVEDGNVNEDNNAHENLIELPENEGLEIDLIDAKLEKLEAEEINTSSAFDGTDVSLEVGCILKCDVEIHDKKRHSTSSDDEIPLMAYKSSVRKKYKKKPAIKKKVIKKDNKFLEIFQTDKPLIVDSVELTCDLCSEIVGDFESLAKHFSEQHKFKKTFVKCCRRTFTEKKRLISHLHWHRNPEEYRCTVCKKIMSSKKYLKIHMSVRHEGEGDDAFNCDLCSRSFSSRKRFETHKRLHKSEENFTCHVCGKCYTTQHRLDRHFQGIHGFVYPYKCLSCGQPFNFKADLDKHNDECQNKTLFNRISTGDVLDEEDKLKEESMCKICHKIFHDPKQVQRHIQSMHEFVTPYVCDQCGKKFKFKPAFEKHLLEHSGIVDPPMQCNICGNWLKNKHTLRLHLYRHDDGNRKCHLCDRICPSRRALQGHIKNVHREEKNYKCKYCEKSFKSSTNLEEHVATHTGAQLYSCPHCSKESRSHSNMYVHIKRMHPEEWLSSKLARSNNPNINTSLAHNNYKK